MILQTTFYCHVQAPLHVFVMISPKLFFQLVDDIPSLY